MNTKSSVKLFLGCLPAGTTPEALETYIQESLVLEDLFLRQRAKGKCAGYAFA